MFRVKIENAQKPEKPVEIHLANMITAVPTAWGDFSEVTLYQDRNGRRYWPTTIITDRPIEVETI